MVKRLTKYVVLLVAGLSLSLAAQPNTFVSATVNAKNVKVKQPFELRISVYTPTWFTSAPNLDNIVIPGALTIKKDRAHSRYENINGVRHTILYFDFIVFPLKEGELLIPEITLQYSTPEQGDYKGKQVERKTKPIKVTVEKPEDGFTFSEWLTASRFSVSERWNKKLSGLKVGDVIERTITTKATGTVGALIPESDSVDIPLTRTYRKTPIIKSEIIDGVPVGHRIETITYLLEKPGELVIPEQKYSWWNPATKRIYTKRLTAKKIIVEDNPDLAILKSIQDSLDAINKPDETEEVEEKPFTIFGLLIWQFLILLGVVIVVVNQFRKLILVIIKKIAEKKAIYLRSEKFYFKKFEQACRQNDLILVHNRIVEWLFKLCEGNRLLSMREFIEQYGNDELLNLYNLFEEKLFGKENAGQEFYTLEFCNLMKEARKKYLNCGNIPVAVNLLKLNP